MIVCHCRIVTDQDVRRAVERGARTIEDVKGPARESDCGCCRGELDRLIASETLKLRRPTLRLVRPAATAC